MCDGTIDNLINLPEGLEFINKTLVLMKIQIQLPLKMDR